MSEYHEPDGDLTDEVRDQHRALTSLKEEIEAVDWYNQRWAASKNESLRAVLAHNRDEEIEHACMAIEWLRRNVPKFDEHLRTYLFTEAPITEVEHAAKASEAGASPASKSGSSASAPASTTEQRGDLGIGSIRRPQ
jgi:ferritin-like protein